MLSDKMISMFNQNKIDLENARTRVNNIYDTSLEVINFLIIYKDDWVLEENQIKFRTQALYNYYVSLVNKVSESSKVQ